MTKLRYFVAIAIVAVACGSALAHAAVTAGGSKPSSPGAAGNVYDWQSLGHDDSHTAYLNDSKMDVTIAKTLGVHWMTSLQAADVGSPTVAYNPTVGKTLVYAGNERGDMQAMDIVTGQAIWSTSVGVGDSIYSTPLITKDESSVWFGTAFNSTFYKLNAATGAIECRKPQLIGFQSSATEGQDASGTSLAYISTIDIPGVAGPELAYKISDCSLVFSSNYYKTPDMGSWASAAYGVDSKGRPLIFVGTSDPDNSEYALDATTGARRWDFVTIQNKDWDIGAATTVSPPGKNGFADGVLYLVAKDNILYALNLTTGTLIWKYNFGENAGLARNGATHAVRRAMHGAKPPPYPDSKGAGRALPSTVKRSYLVCRPACMPSMR